MKLVVMSLTKLEAVSVTEALACARFALTRIDSASGFDRETRSTLLVRAEDTQVEEAIRIIEGNCRVRRMFPRVQSPEAALMGALAYTTGEVPTEGATLLLVDVEQVERFGA